MDSKLLKEYQVFVSNYRANVADFSTSVLRRFDDILKQASVEFPAFSIEPWSGSAVAIALNLIGPRHEPLTPQILTDFLKVTDQYRDTTQERMLECAVAYGCGKWRQINKQGSAWSDIWNPSITLLAQAIEPAVKESNLWLSDIVIDYGRRDFWLGRNTLLNEGASVIASDAMMLALQLMQPFTQYQVNEGDLLQIFCDESGVKINLGDNLTWQELSAGSRSVIAVTSACELLRIPTGGDADVRVLAAGDEIKILATDEGARLEFAAGQSVLQLKQAQTARFTTKVDIIKRSCTCGHKACNERHNINSWNAGSRISLWAYCASAVKGPHVNLHTGTYEQGMYYALLSKHGNFLGNRVRLVPVEYKLCQTQSCQNESGTRRYEGLHCPWCNKPGIPETTPRIPLKRLIAITDIPVYERLKRFRCKNRHIEDNANGKLIENLCEVPTCSICEAELNKHRPVAVWVRQFSKRLSLDEIDSTDRKLIDSKELLEISENDDLLTEPELYLTEKEYAE